MVVNHEGFCLSENIWQRVEIQFVTTGRCSWYAVGRDRGAAKHPPVHETHPHNKEVSGLKYQVSVLRNPTFRPTQNGQLPGAHALEGPECHKYLLNKEHVGICVTQNVPQRTGRVLSRTLIFNLVTGEILHTFSPRPLKQVTLSKAHECLRCRHC